MKYTLFFLLMFFFLFGCKEAVDPLDQNKLTASVINESPTCKNSNSLALKMIDVLDTFSCIEYSYDVNNKQLLLKHINAGFNCCSSRFKSGLLLEGDTIIVEEYEEGEVCDCECLYDLDIVIENVSLQRYYFKINDDSLNFELDLKRESSGSYCVTKKEYPWGMSLTTQ